jgi:hypothetical protein
MSCNTRIQWRDKFTIVGTITKSNIEIAERGKMDTPSKQARDRSPIAHNHMTAHP